MLAKKLSTALFFIILCIILQKIFTGVDFFIVGIIILLQKEKFKELLAILPIFIIITEGTGTLIFGSSVLLYFCVIILFFIGKWAFRVENFVFIFLLSGAISLCHYYIFTLVANLDNIIINESVLINECTMQALLIPLFWIVLHYLQKFFADLTG